MKILGTEASCGSTRELAESHNHCDRFPACGFVGCVFLSSSFLSHSSQLALCSTQHFRVTRQAWRRSPRRLQPVIKGLPKRSENEGWFLIGTNSLKWMIQGYPYFRYFRKPPYMKFRYILTLSHTFPTISADDFSDLASDIFF